MHFRFNQYDVWQPIPMDRNFKRELYTILPDMHDAYMIRLSLRNTYAIHHAYWSLRYMVLIHC